MRYVNDCNRIRGKWLPVLFWTLSLIHIDYKKEKTKTVSGSVISDTFCISFVKTQLYNWRISVSYIHPLHFQKSPIWIQISKKTSISLSAKCFLGQYYQEVFFTSFVKTQQPSCIISAFSLLNIQHLNFQKKSYLD